MNTDSIKDATIAELRRQNAALLARLTSAQNFIRTFPELLTKARLDVKEGKPTNYNYVTHAALLRPVTCNPVVINTVRLSESALDAQEQREFLSLVVGHPHPFTGRAAELQEKSGLPWEVLEG